MKKSLLKFIIFLTLNIFLIGCSKLNINVSPEIIPNKTTTKKLLYNKLDYNKFNKEYLPQQIQADKKSKINLHYDYSIVYNNGNTNLDTINLFNPLVLFGFSLSETYLAATGKLIIEKDKKVIATYNAKCAVKKTRNLFNSNGTSKARKECLIAIRKSIDSQIIKNYKRKVNEY